MDIAITSVILGLFGLVIAWLLSVRTDKLIKSEDERAKRMIDESRKETQQTLIKMEEGLREMLERMDYRWEEGLLYISSLISKEEEKTRELINQILRKVA